METVKVNAYMSEYLKILDGGGRLTPGQRKLYEQFRTTEKLDQIKVNVLVLGQVGGPSWETMVGASNYAVDRGCLKIEIGGVDADGEYIASFKTVLYPEGRWLKMNSVLEQVPNPFYVEFADVPGTSDGSDRPPSPVGHAGTPRGL